LSEADTAAQSFADTNGIFGIGHVTYRRKLSERDSLILSLDYNGNSSFLPDVPLPGFAFEHRSNSCRSLAGFPTVGCDGKWRRS